MPTDKPMQLGMIGLGRMGANLVRRLMRDGHQLRRLRREPRRRRRARKRRRDGGCEPRGFRSQARQAARRVDHGAGRHRAVARLTSWCRLLDAGDIVIDGGNSYYRDDIAAQRSSQKKDIHYVDCGTSGGVWGLEPRLLPDDRRRAERSSSISIPIFKTIAPGEASRSHARPHPNRRHGAATAICTAGRTAPGISSRWFTTAIEYGMMAAIAEGLSIIKHANAGKHTRRGRRRDDAASRARGATSTRSDVAEVAEVWRRGSVVASWLIDLTADALARSPTLDDYAGRVSDSGEGRWTVQAAIDTGVPASVITAALIERFESRGNGDFADKVLSAMRIGVRRARREEGLRTFMNIPWMAVHTLRSGSSYRLRRGYPG